MELIYDAKMTYMTHTQLYTGFNSANLLISPNGYPISIIAPRALDRPLNFGAPYSEALHIQIPFMPPASFRWTHRADLRCCYSY